MEMEDLRDLDELVPTGKNSAELMNSPHILTRMNSRDLKHLKTAVHIKEELEEHKNTWKSCCLTVDKRFVVFITQALVASSILIFSMIMLFYKDSCDNQIYIGLISTIIGLYMPAPRIS